MDNQLFNVNGSGEDHLLQTLKLLFDLRKQTCAGWSQSKESGLILHWWAKDKKDVHPFPVDRLDAESCFGFVKKWLESDFASEVELSEWCEDIDQDGHNSKGWQIYVEDWGHVGNRHSAICGIKPAFCWHGK